MDERWLTDSTPDERFRVYTRANAGEVLARPCSPLGWTLFWAGAIIPGWRDAYLDLGVLLPGELSKADPPVCGSFGGYLYNNLSMVRTWSIRSPGGSAEAGDRAFIGEHPDLPAYLPNPLDDDAEAKARTAESIGRLLSLDDYPSLAANRAASLELHAARADLSILADADLVGYARDLVPQIRELFREHTIVSIGAAIGPALLARPAADLGDPGIPMRLVAGLGEIDSAAPSLALWELSRIVRGSPELTTLFDAGPAGLQWRIGADGSPAAQEFLAAFEVFGYDFGCRGPDEWDIARDTWETRPELALAAIDRARHVDDDAAPALGHQRRVADREALTAELRATLADDPAALDTLETGLRAARLWLRGRERAKTTIVRVLHEARMALRELAARHADAGHLHDAAHLMQLTATELDAYLADPSAFTDVVAQRHRRFLELHDLQPPYFVDGQAPPLTSWPRRGHDHVDPAKGGEVLTGVGGAPGVVTGRVRVVTDPEDVRDLDPGDVLVAPTTDPSWTALFLTAAAVVVETGAQNSHAVIVARELGLPCVPSVGEATRRLLDGTVVRVDGTAGTVTVLEAP